MLFNHVSFECAVSETRMLMAGSHTLHVANTRMQILMRDRNEKDK